MTVRKSASRLLAGPILCTAVLASCTPARAPTGDGPQDLDGGSGPDGGCPAGGLACAEGCVEPTTDRQHCGRCDRVCVRGDVCAAGACRTPPDDCRTAPCPAGTRCDTTSGTCREGCAAASDCPAPAGCDPASHVCQCPAEQHFCAGACVSSLSPQNCGRRCEACPVDPNGTASCDGTACGVQCSPGFRACGGACAVCPSPGAAQVTCRESACVATACQAGFHMCGDACAADADPQACGPSCARCPADPHGVPACAAGACTIDCDDGFRLCAGACAPCPAAPQGASFACAAGACVLSACPGGWHLCGGACVRSTDTATCADRCEPCPTDPNGAATCDGARCGLSCNLGSLLCAGTCAACPAVADGVFACDAARCVLAGCTTGRHLCGDACVRDDSPSTCGARCEPCPGDAHGAATCTQGACGLSCEGGYRLCGGACTQCPAVAGGVFGCDGAACVLAGCGSGLHECSDSCASDASPDTCGARCEPCPGDPRGSATCRSGTCGLSCNAGSLLCSGACAPCPAAPAGATSSCSGAACAITGCPTGWHLCSGACTRNDAPATCGISCDPCPADAHGGATCDGTRCGIACENGWRLCAGACASCPADAHGARWDCAAASCELRECAAGYLPCGGACASCPSVAHGSYACRNAACVRDGCEPGWRPCAAGCCEWSFDAAATSRDLDIGPPAAAIDGAGTLHAAWRVAPATSSSRRIHVADWAAGHWAASTIGPAGANVGRFDLAAPSTGAVVLVYEDGAGAALGLDLMQRTGTVWTAPADVWTGSAGAPVLAVDASNRLRAAWVDASAHSVMYARQDAAAWSTERVEALPATTSAVQSIALVLDPAGAPHLACTDASAGAPRLVRATKTLAGWTFDDIAAGAARGVSASFDPAGALHVAFVDPGTHAVRHARQEAGGWSVETVEADDGGAGDRTSLRVDAAGTPHLAWRVRRGGGEALRYGRRTPDGWLVSTVISGPSAAAFPALVLDAAGAPHILFLAGSSPNQSLQHVR